MSIGNRGNPNPRLDNLKPFEKGSINNPRGNTPEAWAKRRANAEKAEKVHAWFLEAIENISKDMTPAEKLDLMRHPYLLTITKDAMDRYYGKAGMQLDLLSSDGSQGPTTIRLIAATSSEDDDS